MFKHLRGGRKKKRKKKRKEKKQAHTSTVGTMEGEGGLVVVAVVAAVHV